MQETTKSIFPKGEKNPYGEFFIGQSYLAALAKSPDGNVSVGNVTFEAGCRNNWHVHLDGYQILLVTDKGVRHWHGAKKDSEFAHIAITAGKSEFYEAVSDEEYSRLG